MCEQRNGPIKLLYLHSDTLADLIKPLKEDAPGWAEGRSPEEGTGGGEREIEREREGEIEREGERERERGPEMKRK